MLSSGPRCLLCLLVVFSVMMEPCLGAVAPPRPAQTFANLEEAAATLLRTGDEAVEGWEALERRRARRTRLGDLLIGALFIGMGAWQFGYAQDPFVAGMFPESASAAVAMGHYWAALGSGLVLFGGRSVEEHYRAAIENVGSYRGSYLAKAIRIGPRETLRFAESEKDPSQRSKLLCAVMAASVRHAPQITESAARAMTAALRESPARDENLRTLALALRASESLAADDPAVSVCLDYLRELLSDEASRKPSQEVKEAATAYAYFSPGEAGEWASRFDSLLAQCEVLVSAAEGAFRRGDLAVAEDLLDQSLRTARSAHNLSERVGALGTAAASAAAAGRREELVSEALGAAREAGPRDATELVRSVSLKLAPVDLELALSILTADDQPVLNIDFARQLVPAALRSPPTEAHAALVWRLPRRRELADDLNQLGLELAQAEPASMRAAAEEAAGIALEAAPGFGETEQSRRAVIGALTVLASVNPELAWQSVPQRERRRDPPLFVQAQLRAARGIAETAAGIPDQEQRQKHTAHALELLEGTLAFAPSSHDLHCHSGQLAEVPRVIAGLHRIAPDRTLAVAGKAPQSNLRAAVLMEYGVVQAIRGSPEAQETLDRALSEAREVRDRETREVLVSRAAAALNMVAPEVAELRFSELEIPWARAGVLAITAGLHEDRVAAPALHALAAATHWAAASTAPENRAQAALWVLDVAVSDPTEFRAAVQRTGMPWLAPAEDPNRK